MALDSGAPSISYTYSEPCIHVEFVRECMERAHASGLLNVLVTNGCILAPPARHVLEYCDAANIDLKTGSASIYREMLGGDLATVKEFIGMAVSMRCHVEVTTLAVPGISDDREGIARIAEFLAGLAPVPPLHITPYHPDHLMRAPPLTRARYDSLVAEAEKTLARVFSY